MANNLDHLPKNHNPVFFDIKTDLYRNSAIDYVKMATEEINRGMGLPVEMVDIQSRILTEYCIKDVLMTAYDNGIAGTLFGQPINLHNYPNVGFQKELTMRETLQKEINK